VSHSSKKQKDIKIEKRRHLVIHVANHMSSLRKYRISELVLTGNFPKELGERRPKSSSLTDMIGMMRRDIFCMILGSVHLRGFISSFRTFQ
jgi:hypothetical protein